MASLSRFLCPECSTVFELPTSAAVKKERCPGCWELVELVVVSHDSSQVSSPESLFEEVDGDDSEGPETWFVRRGSKTIGPITVERLLGGLADGKIEATDVISSGPAGPWVELGEDRSECSACGKMVAVTDIKCPYCSGTLIHVPWDKSFVAWVFFVGCFGLGVFQIVRGLRFGGLDGFYGVCCGVTLLPFSFYLSNVYRVEHQSLLIRILASLLMLFGILVCCLLLSTTISDFVNGK